MTLKLIACVNADGNLAGFQPPKADLQRFAALTFGGVVIMGRKTWEALPAKVKPLPNRMNVIISRSTFPNEPGVVHADALGWAIDRYPGAWIIGGGEVYHAAIDLVGRVYLSQTKDTGGSVPFPMSKLNDFQRLVVQQHGDHEFTIGKRV